MAIDTGAVEAREDRAPSGWRTLTRDEWRQAFAGPLLSPIAVSVLGLWTLAGSLQLADGIAAHREGAWIVVGIAAVVMLAALVSSIAGFAFCALAGGALAYLNVEPVHAVRTMVVCSIAIQLYAVWKIRQTI